MKYLFIFIIGLISFTAFAQIDREKWNAEAKSDFRMLPKYGMIEKTEAQKLADKNFITTTLKSSAYQGNATAASNKMISLGFDAFRGGDFKSAMQRFNEAYLLDPDNTDIYWGYGAIYIKMGDSKAARQQYDEGLAAKPDNTHILTDYGNYYLQEYFKYTDVKQKASLLDTALGYMQKSYKLNTVNEDTLFKLSVIYFLKDDCANAKKYYEACIAVDAAPITKSYTEQLYKKCGL